MKDCIIVCGYPANENGTISNILESRIKKGTEVFKKFDCQYLILSGGAIHNSFCEALIMKEYALKQGIDEKYILMEDKAKSTYHNMLYSKEIMEKHNLKNCYIVTNSWHKIKAEYYAKKFELDYIMINADKPEGMSYFKVLLLTIEMPFNMLKMRMKGFK